MFNHTGENGFHCSICELVFNRKSKLEKHIKQVHSKPETDENGCDVCHKTFSGSDALRRHKATHSALRKFFLLIFVFFDNKFMFFRSEM